MYTPCVDWLSSSYVIGPRGVQFLEGKGRVQYYEGIRRSKRTYHCHYSVGSCHCENHYQLPLRLTSLGWRNGYQDNIPRTISTWAKSPMYQYPLGQPPPPPPPPPSVSITPLVKMHCSYNLNKVTIHLLLI